MSAVLLLCVRTVFCGTRTFRFTQRKKIQKIKNIFFSGTNITLCVHYSRETHDIKIPPKYSVMSTFLFVVNVNQTCFRYPKNNKIVRSAVVRLCLTYRSVSVRLLHCIRSIPSRATVVCSLCAAFRHNFV